MAGRRLAVALGPNGGSRLRPTPRRRECQCALCGPRGRRPASRAMPAAVRVAATRRGAQARLCARPMPGPTRVICRQPRPRPACRRCNPGRQTHGLHHRIQRVRCEFTAAQADRLAAGMPGVRAVWKRRGPGGRDDDDPGFPRLSGPPASGRRSPAASAMRERASSSGCRLRESGREPGVRWRCLRPVPTRRSSTRSGTARVPGESGVCHLSGQDHRRPLLHRGPDDDRWEFRSPA